MYAVIKTGGKQYKVASGDILKIEKIAGDTGEVINLKEVLAASDGKNLKIGSPILEKASVEAEILEQKKDNKVLVFKKKRRQNYRRFKGHRQEVTVLRIGKINL